MANITLDFLHNYHTGERRESDPANAYQYDEGHVLEAVLPAVVTTVELHYWIRGMEEAEAYTPTSITPNDDNSCTVLGNIPNKYFETNGELRIYIVVNDADASITTYEGKLNICQRSKPDDYVDDDPDNEATRVLVEARGYAETSEAWAVGQINGEDVPSTADQYQNNAAYYAAQAAAAASSAAAQASIADLYDATSTYAVGDYCLYNGQLYQCTTAISTAEAWTAAHWTAVTVGDELSSLKEDLDDEVARATTAEEALEESLETKAEIDGYYEDMTVGDAEQLVASQYVEDSVPYGFRTTGGSADVGNREYVDVVVGGMIAWNQLVRSANVDRVNGTLTYDQNTNTYTFIAEGTDSRIYNNYAKTLNHVYLTIATVTSSVSGTLKNEISFGWANKTVSITADTPLAFSSILKVASGTEPTPARSPQFFILNMSSYTLSIKDWMFFDLTQMFGSTIADYIYSLEQANAGAGVTWFKKLFPKDYYEYDAGTLKSVEGLSAHTMVGFNAWDEEWEEGSISNVDGTDASSTTRFRTKNYIPMIPNATYYLKSTDTVGFRWYDANKHYVSAYAPTINSTFTVPDGVYFLRFVDTTKATYSNDICINLSWSGWRNGEYEAYQKHSYPLDSDLVLRGIPKLDAQNNLYYDGDEYLPDGTVNRRYGVVDLGTLSWIADSNRTGVFYTNDIARLAEKNGAIMSADYSWCSNSVPSSANVANYDKLISLYPSYGAGYIYIIAHAFDANTGAEVAMALSGKYAVYELATPTTETAEPYQQVQICDDFGTEEYVSTSIVPVGHSTRYPANLRDKLQHLPDLADDDGYYMIGQSNKQMHLELFRIPKAPTTDGIYTLKATVSGGTPTYTWEAQT